MKKLLFVFGFVAIVAGRAFGGLTPEQLGRFQQQLSDSDPKARLAALEALQKANLVTAGNNILPLLSKALRDPDQTVRASAAASLASIAFVTMPKLREPSEDNTDLRSYPALKKTLIETLRDPDEQIRKNVLAAFVMTFEVPPALQDDLVSRYDSERPGLFRMAILGAVTIDGTPTAAAKVLLLRVAGTPDGSVALAQIVKDSKAPPAELLPIFVNQFNTATDALSRAAFIRAIKPYGAQAKPYLPTLERAAEVESDEMTKQNIKRAIATIQSAK
jgi:HEAT repeat protein